MFEEILNKYDKIQGLTKLTDEQLKELIFLLLKRVDFIDNDLISEKNQQLSDIRPLQQDREIRY